MALYLVQHGKSLPKDVDPDQGLSEEGVTDTERIAKVAQNCGVMVSKIKHSGKTRAQRIQDRPFRTDSPSQNSAPAANSTGYAAKR